MGIQEQDDETVSRVTNKAARLLVLHHLKVDGLLDELTQSELGVFFGVNRSTILRDQNSTAFVAFDQTDLLL